MGRKEGERVVNPEAVDARIERRTNFMMACEGCVSECGVLTIVLTLSDNIYLAFIRLMSLDRLRVNRLVDFVTYVIVKRTIGTQI